MQAQWRPIPFSPMPFSPLPRRLVSRPAVPALGQASTALGMGFAGLILTLDLAMSAATTWVGFDTGMRRKGFLSVLGYVVGAGGVIGALITVPMIAGLTYAAVTNATKPTTQVISGR